VLTLGLVEGVLSATLGILVLVGAANENAPLHRIFGPMVVVVVGVAAYGVHAAGAMHEAADVVGLAAFASLAFIAPLAVMRYAWKQTRLLTAAAPLKSEAVSHQPTLEPVSHVEPQIRKVA
jgi:hypothetical protein